MQINLQKHISLFIILIILLFHSCSFNKLFLQPTKIPATTKKATLKAEKDTVTVYFSGETHQPSFMFDYSGFGFSEGKPTRVHVLADALAALDYIKTRQDVNNTKLVIYGQSLGGHLSAVVAAKRENDISGLVIEGAFSSHKDIGGHMVPFFGKLFVKQGYSAIKSIKNFHKPLLVIHSTEDQTIPFYMGKKIFDNANQPKEFYEVKKCHICAPIFFTEEIADKIKKMLNEK